MRCDAMQQWYGDAAPAARPPPSPSALPPVLGFHHPEGPSSLQHPGTAHFSWCYCAPSSRGRETALCSHATATVFSLEVPIWRLLASRDVAVISPLHERVRNQ